MEEHLLLTSACISVKVETGRKFIVSVREDIQISPHHPRRRLVQMTKKKMYTLSRENLLCYIKMINKMNVLSLSKQ